MRRLCQYLAVSRRYAIGRLNPGPGLQIGAPLDPAPQRNRAGDPL